MSHTSNEINSDKTPAEQQVAINVAFSKAMEGRLYGSEETADARGWFEKGYLAALSATTSSTTG